jgi:transposase-like protein
MHVAKKRRIMMKRGRSIAGKVAVMALLERHDKPSSQVRLHVLHSLKRSEVQGFVRGNVAKGATVNTDAFHSYTGLIADYSHKVIDHAEAYVDGEVHTNNCENFWSLLKRAIRGTYVSVEPFHLFRYLDEQAFRFNNRVMNDAERFAHALKGIINKRLTYTGLTGKELPQTC